MSTKEQRVINGYYKCNWFDRYYFYSGMEGDVGEARAMVERMKKEGMNSQNASLFAEAVNNLKAYVDVMIEKGIVKN